MKVAIIDYGVGNLRSVEKAFAATGCEAVVSASESELRAAERLVLPGVGAFAACIKALSERGFDGLVKERAQAGTPLLGVCVGMQLLFDESDEFGSTPGLGLLRGQVRRVLGRRGVPGRAVILYGGSVNQGNVLSLLARTELDGVLVGGASLEPDGWAELVGLSIPQLRRYDRLRSAPQRPDQRVVAIDEGLRAHGLA